MRARFSILGLCAFLHAQPPAVRDLFPPKPVAACALPSQEVKDGDKLVQVFTNPANDRELFRLGIGDKVDGEWLKWWKFGIQNCGDFNRDGILDYTWHGGDDTTQEHYLLLSTSAGYRKISIEETFERHWARTRPDKQPDLLQVNETFLKKITLEYSAGKLTLRASGTRKKEAITMAVDQAAWVAVP